MEEKIDPAGPAEAPKRWEKPVVSDVSLESDEDVLGMCFSPSMLDMQSVCGSHGPCHQ